MILNNFNMKSSKIVPLLVSKNLEADLIYKFWPLNHLNPRFLHF